VNAGIFVVGAARSGTSMVTRVVNLLGVPTVAEDDLKPADEDNPRGYFESRSLTTFNRRLLLEVGGAPYSLAPRFPDGWTTAPSLDPLREEARELMQSLHPTTPWVWKDPRTGFTLPFWIDVTGVDPVVVLVHRDPLEVADSLVRRDDAPIPVTLAAWERHNRAALVNARGLPTFVVRYERLLAAPRSVATEIASFLRGHGVEVGDPGPEVDAFVEPALRRSRADANAPNLPSAEQTELVRILQGLEGPHDALPAPELPAETPWVDGLLQAERETGMLELLGARRKAARELDRNTARGQFLGVELRVVRGSVAWRILSPFARVFSRRRR
jgi:hypothetical protein